MSRIQPEDILRVANTDATKAYRSNLNDCRIKMCLLDDGWHVDYEIMNPKVHGGAPHYIICPETGEITWKSYEQ